MKVGIIHNRPIPRGEPNWESSTDVMVQVEALGGSLTGLGHPWTAIPFTRDLAGFAARLKAENIEVAFNLCESVDEDPLLIGHPAVVLELLGLPFTGSPSQALTVSTDKLFLKKLLQASDLRTPAYFYYDGGEPGQRPDLTFPLLMKPRWQDASIGIDQESIVRDPADLLPALNLWYRSYGPLLVEEFLDGREFNVSLLGHPSPRVMPLAEIDFTGFPGELFRIVGYRAKWDENSAEYHTTNRAFPNDLPENLVREISYLSRQCFELFGLRDYGRVDLRLDGHGRPYVLEVNANPCLSPDAGFAAAVARGGLDYTAMVAELLHLVMMRGAQ